MIGKAFGNYHFDEKIGGRVGLIHKAHNTHLNRSAPATNLRSILSGIREMGMFGGLSEEETEVLGVSSRTVKRDWRLARNWLFAS